jgi:hypothetical protein
LLSVLFIIRTGIPSTAIFCILCVCVLTRGGGGGHSFRTHTPLRPHPTTSRKAPLFFLVPRNLLKPMVSQSLMFHCRHTNRRLWCPNRTFQTVEWLSSFLWCHFFTLKSVFCQIAWEVWVR